MKNSDPVSQRQKKYLLDIRRNSILIQVSRILLFVFFVGLWEISARTGLIDSFIFSSPGQILEKMWEMLLDHTLIDHVSITLLETLISFALVTVLGIGCGVLLWAFPRLSSRPSGPWPAIWSCIMKASAICRWRPVWASWPCGAWEKGTWTTWPTSAVWRPERLSVLERPCVPDAAGRPCRNGCPPCWPWQCPRWPGCGLSMDDGTRDILALAQRQ